MISAVSSQDNYNQTGLMDPAAMIKQMLEKLFAKADANGDGTITQDEFTQFLDANPKAAKMFARLLSVTGADGTSGSNGTATTPSVDDIFKQVDTNGDGALSKDELAAALQKMHPRGRHHHHVESQDAQGSNNSQESIIINLVSNASQNNGSTDSTGLTGLTGSTGASSGTAGSGLLAEILTQDVKVDVYA